MKIVLTLIITVLLLLLTMFLAGGGHGTYLPAKLIFPYTMTIAEFKDEIGIIGIFLAIAQTPIYALILSKKPKWKFYLIGIHIVLVVICLSLNTDTFSG